MNKLLKFTLTVFVVFLFGVAATGGVFIAGSSSGWFHHLPHLAMATVFIWAVLLVSIAVFYVDQVDKS